MTAASEQMIKLLRNYNPELPMPEDVRERFLVLQKELRDNQDRPPVVTRKHSHYFRNVSHLTEIDVYRVCDLFQIDDPSGATQHALKKLLLPGKRGTKDRIKDLNEAVDTLLRRLQMLEEDEKPCLVKTLEEARDKLRAAKAATQSAQSVNYN